MGPGAACDQEDSSGATGRRSESFSSCLNGLEVIAHIPWVPFNLLHDFVWLNLNRWNYAQP